MADPTVGALTEQSTSRDLPWLSVLRTESDSTLLERGWNLFLSVDGIPRHSTCSPSQREPHGLRGGSVAIRMLSKQPVVQVADSADPSAGHRSESSENTLRMLRHGRGHGESTSVHRRAILRRSLAVGFWSAFGTRDDAKQGEPLRHVERPEPLLCMAFSREALV